MYNLYNPTVLPRHAQQALLWGEMASHGMRSCPMEEREGANTRKSKRLILEFLKE